jgi:hypothetical protein
MSGWIALLIVVAVLVAAGVFAWKKGYLPKKVHDEVEEFVDKVEDEFDEFKDTVKEKVDKVKDKVDKDKEE